MLFSDEDEAHTVPGLTVRPGYIDVDTERALLAHVDEGPWEQDFKRRIQQYGYGYSNTGVWGSLPTWVRDIPAWLAPLGARLVDDGLLERAPENAVINEYTPGIGIGKHKDYSSFGPTVACISLGSDVVIDFIEPDRGYRVPVLVPARSLWVATGEARRWWLHAIAPRKSDVVDGERRPRGRRVSITFRTVTDRVRRQRDLASAPLPY